MYSVRTGFKIAGHNQVFFLMIILYLLLVAVTGVWEAWRSVSHQRQELEHQLEQQLENNDRLLKDLQMQYQEIRQMEKTIDELEDILNLRKTMYREVVKENKGTKFDLTRPSGFTPDMLDASFQNNGGGSLQGTGEAFIRAEKEHGVNALALAAISANETGWGTSRLAREKNNYFGWGAYDRNPYRYASRFKSVEHSVKHVGERIKSLYLSPGGSYYHEATLKGMNVRYASDSQWAHKTASIMHRIIEEAMPPEEAEKYLSYEEYDRIYSGKDYYFLQGGYIP